MLDGRDSKVHIASRIQPATTASTIRTGTYPISQLAKATSSHWGRTHLSIARLFYFLLLIHVPTIPSKPANHPMTRGSAVQDLPARVCTDHETAPPPKSTSPRTRASELPSNAIQGLILLVWRTTGLRRSTIRSVPVTSPSSTVHQSGGRESRCGVDRLGYCSTHQMPVYSSQRPFQLLRQSKHLIPP